MTNDSPAPEIPVRFDAETHTYQATYDTAQISPSLAVVTVMARIRGTAPTEMNPLYETIDPTALDTLLEPPTTDHTPEGRMIKFSYLGYTVRATSGGHIEVEPPTGTRPNLGE